MSKVFDFDPLTGMVEKIDFADGKMFLHSQQNVEPLLDRNKRLANEGVTDVGIKKGLWHAFSLPNVVRMEMKKKGINTSPRTPAEWKKLFQEVESNYPYLKTTHKRLA